MAFKRTSVQSLMSTKRESFSANYKFSAKVPNFKVGSDVYVLLLGLDTGFYQTPCHAVKPHKIGDKKVGFNGLTFGVNIKCKGMREDGSRDPEALCCKLAAIEREKHPGSEDYMKRIISGTTNRIHVPILILGNTIGDESKISYPVSKISITQGLSSGSGLKFSYIEVATSTFRTEILEAYGEQLRNEGKLPYDIDKESPEFFEEVIKRLQNTVVKIRGIKKEGFAMALKSYNFFPFDNPSIACESGAGEREAIINYRNNPEIVRQIGEYLALFDVEVDHLIMDWSERDLQEYYNSAIGAPLSTNLTTPEEQPVIPKVELKESVTYTQPQVQPVAPQVVQQAVPQVQPTVQPQVQQVVQQAVPQVQPTVQPTVPEVQPMSDEEFDKMLNNPDTLATEAEQELQGFEFDPNEDGDFFGGEEA